MLLVPESCRPAHGNDKKNDGVFSSAVFPDTGRCVSETDDHSGRLGSTDTSSADQDRQASLARLRAGDLLKQVEWCSSSVVL